MGRYRKLDEDFKQGAVAAAAGDRETDRAGARKSRVNDGTLGDWVTKARR